jgi:hypothetical protein
MFDETVVGHAITKRQQADRSSMRPETGAPPTQLLHKALKRPPSFTTTFFCPPFFCQIPLSPLFVSLGYHRKISCRSFLLAERRKRKRKTTK